MVLLRERYRACLIGLAAGDALGTTLEFTRPGAFMPISDMLGGGPFSLQPGQWTDDTSMALCLAESLVHCAGFDARDQMQRYVRWQDEGHLSSNGRCFDIGNTVASALQIFKNSGEPLSGSTEPRSAGNGSLMRLAPVPMAFRAQPRIAIAHCAQSSRTTHGASEAVDACRYYGALIIGALEGVDKKALLAADFSPADGLWEAEPLAEAVQDIAQGSYKRKQPPKIRGSGYVVDAMEAALWAFYSSDNFKQGALLAVNLGEDADTTGAIYGQLAGAYYGLDAIPALWRGRLTDYSMMLDFADRLYALSESLTERAPGDL